MLVCLFQKSSLSHEQSWRPGSLALCDSSWQFLDIVWETNELGLECLISRMNLSLVFSAVKWAPTVSLIDVLCIWSVWFNIEDVLLHKDDDDGLCSFINSLMYSLNTCVLNTYCIISLLLNIWFVSLNKTVVDHCLVKIMFSLWADDEYYNTIYVKK